MIRTVGIISRPRREDIARVVPPLVDWLQAHGAEVTCDSETSDCIGRARGRDAEARGTSRLHGHADRAGRRRDIAFRGAARGGAQSSHPGRQPGRPGLPDDRFAGRTLFDSGRDFYRQAPRQRTRDAGSRNRSRRRRRSGGRSRSTMRCSTKRRSLASWIWNCASTANM